MKKLLLIFCVFAASAVADTPPTELFDVFRFTYIDGKSYTREAGTLTAQGFVSGGKVTYKYTTFAPWGGTAADIKAVSGKVLMERDSWKWLVANSADFRLANFRRASTKTFWFQGNPAPYVDVQYSRGANGGTADLGVVPDAPSLASFAGSAYIPKGKSVEVKFTLIVKGDVLIRVKGPAFKSKSVPDFFPDPKFTLATSSKSWGSNDNWGSPSSNKSTVTQASKIVKAKAFASGSKDAAKLFTLKPGQYTVTISGPKSAQGWVYYEIFELPSI